MIKGFREILFAAIRIDILDMNYIYSNSAILQKLLSSDKTGLPRRGLLIRIIAFFGNGVRNIQFKSWVKQAKISKNSILFYSKSRNQKFSLEPLLDNLDSAIILGNHVEFSFSLTTFFAYLFSFPFFPLVLISLLKSEGIIREGFYYNFNLYWLTYGFYISVRLWLKYIKPKVLVVGNDHIMEHRVMVKAAKDEGVPTIYIQHASVTSDFPPLAFDYALLEGNDALQIYNKIGKTNSIAFLIGNPKFDKYINNINLSEKIDSIGICANWLEPIDRIEELCSVLTAEFPTINFYLRPHPQDKRIFLWEKIVEKYNIKLSQSNEEFIFDFLKKVDLIFAGNTNVHLEAALVNVYPIYYDFALNPKFESYSFVKTGLCEYISDPVSAGKRIKELINNRPNIRIRTKHYCNTVNTLFDGHSSQLASELIFQIAEGNEALLNNWSQIKGFDLLAYGPIL